MHGGFLLKNGSTEGKDATGKQEVEKCKGSEVTDRLKTLLSGALTEKSAGFQLKALLNFDKTIDTEETLS